MARTKSTARKGLTSGRTPHGSFGVQNETSDMKPDADDPLAGIDGVTSLYRHDCPQQCCASRWSPYSNHQNEQQGVNAGTTAAPIVHRKTFCNKKWITQSFTVQHPEMRALLQTALANYQDLDLGLANYTFAPPFNPLVHRWDELEAMADEMAGTPQEAPLTQLMDFLRPLLGPSVEALALTRKTGKVDFENLWHIFSPSSHAITTLYGVEAVCRITKHEKIEPDWPQRPYWSITLEYVDWNGECSGYTNTKVIVKEFDGFRHVVSLPVYPISFHKHAEEVEARMIERGRKSENLRGYHFRTCRGTKVLLQTEEPEQRPVDGRVVVDAHAFYRSSDTVKLQLKPLNRKQKEKAADSAEGDVENQDDVDEGDGLEEDCEEDEDSDSWQVASVTEGPTMTAKAIGTSMQRNEVLTPLTDEQCLLSTPWLRGFDLKTKEWASFNVEELAPIVWNDAAFDHLVLPGKEKQLAWEFVENKALADNQFDDFVPDKGRGLIILMYGPPGVGKTFTAEAVAERARVPLYGMSAGTLGTNPRKVEQALSKALELCEMWHAMLLLDEADVFLTARNCSDLARNELVAIFLTKLEYYPGVCFLTTNRIGTMDHAFQSRVDLFLPYQDLAAPARRQVWSSFVDRAGRDKFALTANNLDQLAKLELNGREIKNLIKSAHLLSVKSGEPIGYDRIHDLASNRLRALDTMAKP